MSRSTIKAERTDDGKYFTERVYRSFERHIPLEGVQEDKAEASFQDAGCVLTITVPKSEEVKVSVVRQFETDQAFREERLWLIRGANAESW